MRIAARYGPPPVVAAHRGASRLLPENTLGAFDKALQLGARAIELDVQMSADGEVVVFHDFALDRTSNGTGWVRAHTWSQLALLDVGGSGDPAYSRARIPRLQEALDLIKGRGFVNVELKPNTRNDIGFEAKVAQIVRDSGMARDVVFTSFDHVAIRRIKAVAPDIAAVVTLGARLAGELDYVRRVGADGSNHSLLWWTPELVDAYHAADLIVHGSLAETLEDLLYARRVGVDLIDSDNPELYGRPDTEV